MEYYARVLDGLVVQVVVSSFDSLPNHSDSSVWVKTFVDGSQRFNRAGPGFAYDETLDAFIPPQPYVSWVLDETTCLWAAPIAYPAEGEHVWDEKAGDWVEVAEDTVE